MITEKTKVDFGVYNGVLVGKVPARYWLWCYEHERIPPVYRKWVRHNFDKLLKEKTDEANETATKGRRSY